MDLVLEHKKSVRAYLDGMLSLSDLEDWLGRYAEAVDEVDDTRARQLYAKTWRVISEYSSAHRDEQSVRSELKKLVAAR